MSEEHEEEVLVFQQRLKDTQDRVNTLERSLFKEKSKTLVLREAMQQAVEDCLRDFSLPPVEPPPKDRRRRGEEYGISLLSDVQACKTTHTYNSEIAMERVAQYGDKVNEITDLHRETHPVKTHHTFWLGDIVEGELIFPGQAHHIDASLYDQIFNVAAPALADYVRRLLANHEKVVVHAVWGNHGYLGGRSRREMHPKSNADLFTYRHVEALLADEPRVEWNISEDWYGIADLGERLRFFLFHGNNVRGYNGIPWYGFQKKIQGWNTIATRLKLIPEFDYWAAGHFHTPISMYFNGIRGWVNGTTESYNTYALEQLGAMGEPSQFLLFGKPGRGITAEYLIDLD